MIEKKAFRKYNLKENEKKQPLSLKLNEQDENMVAIGGYVLNMHSKGGILKELAHIGLKVILTNLGVDRMHRLTRGDRMRLVHEKPKCLEKVNDIY